MTDDIDTGILFGYADIPLKSIQNGK